MKSMLKAFALGMTFAIGSAIIAGAPVTEASPASTPTVSNSLPQLTNCSSTYYHYGRDGHWHTYHRG